MLPSSAVQDNITFSSPIGSCRKRQMDCAPECLLINAKPGFCAFLTLTYCANIITASPPGINAWAVREVCISLFQNWFKWVQETGPFQLCHRGSAVLSWWMPHGIGNTHFLAESKTCLIKTSDTALVPNLGPPDVLRPQLPEVFTITSAGKDFWELKFKNILEAYCFKTSEEEYLEWEKFERQHL